MASYIKAETHISIVFDSGETTTIYKSQPNFESVCNAIKANDWNLAERLAFPVTVFKQKTERFNDRVLVEHGIVTLDGTPINNSLTARMLQMVEDGFDVSPMAKFLENLMDNPSYRAVTELYDFMEHSNLPITEDGYFLAYKRVDDNFKDMYTHTIDNSPGKVVEMPRNRVNEDKNETCSYGLHFCSRDYLPHYGNRSDSKVVLVKINPRDVVSIPVDYNNAKGRCCKYTVIQELAYDDDRVERNEYMPEEELETTSVYVEPAPVVEPVKHSNKVVGKYFIGDSTEAIAIYDSPKQAQEFTGVDSSSITKVCNGKRNTAGGYIWKWI